MNAFITAIEHIAPMVIGIYILGHLFVWVFTDEPRDEHGEVIPNARNTVFTYISVISLVICVAMGAYLFSII